jgi:hypothetical protein
LAYRGNGAGQTTSINSGNGNQYRTTDPQYDCDGVPYQTPAYQGQNGAGNQGANNEYAQNQMLGSQVQNGTGSQGANNEYAQNQMLGSQTQNGTGGQNQAPGSQGLNGTGNQGTTGTGVPQVLADVDEWITVEGTVTGVELNAVTIETTDGESLLAQLGPNTFWTNLDVVLEAGDDVQITGFYEDGSFTAGSVTLLATGETMDLRDADGRPLWSGGRRGQGQNS